VHGIYEVVYFAGEPLTILEIVGALAERSRFQSWCRSWGEENVADGRWPITKREWSSWSDDERYRYALEKLVRPKVHYMTHKGHLISKGTIDIVTSGPVSDNISTRPPTAYSAGTPPPRWRYARHEPGRMEQFLPDVERAKGDRHLRTMQLKDRVRELREKRRRSAAEIDALLDDLVDLWDVLNP
jgi:hypothetical protein